MSLLVIAKAEPDLSSADRCHGASRRRAQTCRALSRDDARSFLGDYTAKGRQSFRHDTRMAGRRGRTS